MHGRRPRGAASSRLLHGPASVAGSISAMQQRSPLRGTARWIVVVAAAALALAACSKDVDPDQALKQGLAQQQAGNLEEAAKLYQQVLDARPGDKYANYNLGVIEQHDGRSEVAEGYYRAALDADPNFVPALFNLAIVRTGVGATQEAMDLYHRVIALEPNTAAAYLNLGLLYRGAGQSAERPRSPPGPTPTGPPTRIGRVAVETCWLMARKGNRHGGKGNRPMA